MIDRADLGELITLDPAFGLGKTTSAARWMHGTLIAVGTFTLPKRGITGESAGARMHRVAQAVIAWATELGAAPRLYVYEWPQVIRAGRSKGDPNDLPGLAAVGAAVAAGLAVLSARQNVGLRVVTRTPAEWTGGVPKVTEGDPWASARGVRVAARLSVAERVLVPDSHDAIDAVGLGLHALGRFEPRRVFPGAVEA